jgi:uncharacterized integral membrane protein
MSRIFRLAVALVVLLFGLAFHLRNDGFVTLDYYAGSLDLPFSLWLFLMVVLGVVLGIAACVPALLRARRECRRLLRQVRGAQADPGGGDRSQLRDAP